MYEAFWRPKDRQTWDDGTNEVIWDGSPYFKLRLFRRLGAKKRHNCIVLFPPHAGRHPNVTNRLIATCQNIGFDVYVFEQIAGNFFNRNLKLAELVGYGRDCWNFIADPKIMIGVCQGLWYSIFVADRIVAGDKPVAQFGFAGPVDFHAGNGYIKNACQLVPIDFIRLIINMNFGLQSGLVQWSNFALMDPKAVFWDNYMKLFGYILAGNEQKIGEWHDIDSWYLDCYDLPGRVIEEVFESLFKNNKLIEMVDLRKFDWPLRLYAGKRDKITPSVQTFAMADLVSTGPEQVRKYLFEECGHTAVFCHEEPLQQASLDLMEIEKNWDNMRMAA